MKTLIPLVMVIVSLSGCNEDFSPAGPYDERMVLYSLLRMDSDTQYVRVYSTYNPSESNPAIHFTDTEITDAIVTITDTARIVTHFRDTVVQRTPTSKYGSTVHVYTAYPFRPKSGRTYTLTVQSPTRGTISAKARMTSLGSLELQTGYQEVRFPSAYPIKATSIEATVKLDSNTAAYMVRCILEYGQLINNVIVKKRIEIPNIVKQGNTFRDYTGTYPTLLPKGFAPSPENSKDEIVTFTLESYITILRYLINTIGSDRIQFNRIIIVLNQVDRATYSYYNVANQFSNGVSIRLDQTDFSNINGGYGLFGSVSATEVYIPLPSQITIPSEW